MSFNISSLQTVFSSSVETVSSVTKYKQTRILCKEGKQMNRFWAFLSALHSLAGPLLMLLYPLYASVLAIESTTKVDDEQWLAYWILYSFLTLMEMVIQPVLEWFPIWYDLKLVFVAWLVLPQFKGSAFLYQRYVREQIRKRGFLRGLNSPSGKGKNKFVDFVANKKGEQEAS